MGAVDRRAQSKSPELNGGLEEREESGGEEEEEEE